MNLVDEKKLDELVHIIAFQRKIARDNKTMHDLLKNVFLTFS